MIALAAIRIKTLRLTFLSARSGAARPIASPSHSPTSTAGSAAAESSIAPVTSLPKNSHNLTGRIIAAASDEPEHGDAYRQRRKPNQDRLQRTAKVDVSPELPGRDNVLRRGGNEADCYGVRKGDAAKYQQRNAEQAG